MTPAFVPGLFSAVEISFYNPRPSNLASGVSFSSDLVGVGVLGGLLATFDDCIVEANSRVVFAADFLE